MCRELCTSGGVTTTKRGQGRQRAGQNSARRTPEPFVPKTPPSVATRKLLALALSLGTVSIWLLTDKVWPHVGTHGRVGARTGRRACTRAVPQSINTICAELNKKMNQQTSLGAIEDAMASSEDPLFVYDGATTSRQRPTQQHHPWKLASLPHPTP